MQKLTFINSMKEEMEFSNAAPYVFWKISGIEMPETEAAYTQAAGQHGYTLHSLVLTQRIVKITGHVHGVSGEKPEQAMYNLRKNAAAVCSPILGSGTLKYENDAGKWQIPAFCKSFKYGDKCLGIQTIDITFECPSPFWLSEDKSVVKLAYAEGGMQFPLEFPSYFGFLGYRAEIYNEGNSELPIVITIDGGAVNPIVKNITTGGKIHVQRDFSSSEKLVINTDPNDISIRLIKTDPLTNKLAGENAFGYLSDDSGLFTLAPGLNEILFVSDNESSMSSVTVEFYQRFVGV